MKQRDQKTRRNDSPRSDDPATEYREQAARGEKIAAPIVIPAWQRRDGIFLLLILLLATLLRVLNLGYMEFKADEANNLFVAADIVSRTAFPLVGIQSSIGTYTPPLFAYLMAIPLFFSRNPVIAAGFVALVNSAAVGLSYVFCRRYFGRFVAVVAAVFFAINPWALLYSRKIWQQDLLPLFVMGFFFGLFAAVCEGRKKHLLTCAACLTVTTQLHFSSIYLLVVLALVLAWFRPRIGWGYYLGGIAIALVVYAPYFVFDLLHRGYNLKIYLHALHAPLRFHPEALTTPFAFGSTLGFMHFADWPSLDLLQALLLGAGVIYLFFRRKDPRYGILFLWFCVPSVFLLVSKLDLYPHYFIFFYPIQFIMLGIVADAMMQDLQVRNRVLACVIPALLVVLAGYQLQSSVKFITAISEREQLGWSDYGPPFHFRVLQVRELAQRGIVEPDKVQRTLVEGQSPSTTFKYDFPATKYIVENLNALP